MPRTIRVRERGVHGRAVERAQLEDVAGLDAALLREDAITARTAHAAPGRRDVGFYGHREVAGIVHAGKVHVEPVRAGKEVVHRTQGGIADPTDGGRGWESHRRDEAPHCAQGQHLLIGRLLKRDTAQRTSQLDLVDVEVPPHHGADVALLVRTASGVLNSAGREPVHDRLHHLPGVRAVELRHLVDGCGTGRGHLTHVLQRGVDVERSQTRRGDLVAGGGAA